MAVLFILWCDIKQWRCQWWWWWYWLRQAENRENSSDIQEEGDCIVRGAAERQYFSGRDVIAYMRVTGNDVESERNLKVRDGDRRVKIFKTYMNMMSEKVLILLCDVHSSHLFFLPIYTHTFLPLSSSIKLLLLLLTKILHTQLTHMMMYWRERKNFFCSAEEILEEKLRRKFCSNTHTYMYGSCCCFSSTHTTDENVKFLQKFLVKIFSWKKKK